MHDFCQVTFATTLRKSKFHRCIIPPANPAIHSAVIFSSRDFFARLHVHRSCNRSDFPFFDLRTYVRIAIIAFISYTFRDSVSLFAHVRADEVALRVSVFFFSLPSSLYLPSRRDYVPRRSADSVKLNARVYFENKLRGDIARGLRENIAEPFSRKCYNLRASIAK